MYSSGLKVLGMIFLGMFMKSTYSPTYGILLALGRKRMLLISWRVYRCVGIVASCSNDGSFLSIHILLWLEEDNYGHCFQIYLWNFGMWRLFGK